MHDLEGRLMTGLRKACIAAALLAASAAAATAQVCRDKMTTVRATILSVGLGQDGYWMISLKNDAKSDCEYFHTIRVKPKPRNCISGKTVTATGVAYSFGDLGTIMKDPTSLTCK
jgi:hypothetical protein